MTTPTVYNQSGVVSGIVSASVSFLRSINALNQNAGTRWIQFFDKAVGPVLNDVPVFEFKMSGGTGMIIGDDFFTGGGVRFASGIAWGFSTTQNAYTAATAADHELTLMVFTGAGP